MFYTGNHTTDGTSITTYHHLLLSQSNKTTAWSHTALTLPLTAPLRVVKQSISNKKCILVNNYFLFSVVQDKPDPRQHHTQVPFTSITYWILQSTNTTVVYMGQSTKHRECLYYYFHLPHWLKKRPKHWDNNTTWPDSTPIPPSVSPSCSYQVFSNPEKTILLLSLRLYEIPT